MSKIFTKAFFHFIAFTVLFTGIAVSAQAQYTTATVETGGEYTALAKDASNNLYVTRAVPGSPGVYEVEKYTGGTGTPAVIYTGLTSEISDYPWGLVVASNGDVYISTDFTSNSGQIIKLTYGGGNTYTQSPFMSGKYYSALAIDAGNNLYTAEYDAANSTYAVVKYPAGSTTGTKLYDNLKQATGYSYPTGLAIASNGDIYVADAFSEDPGITDGGHVYKLTAPGYAVSTVSTGQYATALAVDASGNLYSSENSGAGYKFVKYTGGTGTPATIYGSLHSNGILYPWGIALMNDGGIFLDDSDDGISGGALIHLTSPAPIVTTSSGSAAFTAGDNTTSTPVAIDAGITVTDGGSATLASSTVAITGNFNSGQDVLAFTNTSGTTYGNISASYNAATGILTLTSVGATATLAQWQSALQSITYTNTSVSPNTATRTISFSVVDGATNTSNTATRTVTVTATDQTAIVTTTGGTINYVTGTTAKTIDGSVTVSDLDNTTQASGTVSITSGFNSGDVLAFTNTSATLFGNVIGSYNAATGVLTLTSAGATATDAQWANALSATTFSSSSVTAGNRTISFTVSDGTKTSAAATAVVAVLGPPTVTTDAGSAAFVAGDNTASIPIAVDAGIAVTDGASAAIASATVAVTGNFHSGEDVLAFTNDGSTMGNITASYNAATGVLTLSSAGATATLAQLQSALQSVRYTNTATTPNTATRTVSFTIVDGAGNTSNTATRTVTVTATDQTAIVTATGGTTNYVAGTAAKTIDGGISVSDLDNTTQTSATVSVTSGFNSGDVLAFTNTSGSVFGNISGSYNSATGVLTLTSAGATATNAQWANVMSAVTFSSPSSITAGNRTISFTVNDGTKNSAAVTDVVAVSGPPTVTTDAGSAAFVAGDNTTSTPVAVDAGITITDGSATTLASATISITGNFHPGEDVLVFTNNGSTMGNIVASYNAAIGVLTLTSAGATATLAQWQSALQSTTYTNTAIIPNTATRTVSFNINDGANTSNTATRTVTVTGTDQTPIVTTTGGTTSYVAGTAAKTIDGGITVSDLDNTTLVSATASVTSGFNSGDVLAFTNTSSSVFGNIVGSYNAATGVLTLTSAGATATNAQWANVMSAVTFSSPSSITAGNRTISFTINDGTKNSAAVTDVVAVSGPPTVTTDAGSAAFVAGDNTASTPVAVDAGIAVTDGSATTLTSATVAITGNFHLGEDVLAFTNNGSTMGNITASYNAATGVLTLTSAGATATLAQWQSALQSTTYINTAVSPNTATRTVSFTVVDGAANTSNTATRTVTVTATDQTPILASTAGATTYAGTATVIDGSITVSDLDNTTQPSATISISSGFNSGDVLAFTNTSSVLFGNVVGSYNAATGVLTLTSAGATATNAQWANALSAATFASTSGTTGTRTISFATNDGTKTSAAVTQTVNWSTVITSVAVPANNTYKLGDVLSFTINFSDNVTVTGTPQLGLTIGSSGKQASYVSGSGSSALTFSYTVSSGDLDADGIAIGALALNGGTIKAGSIDATLTLNSVGSTAGVNVDGIVPTLTITSDQSQLKIGETATITFTFSEDPGSTFDLADVTISGGALSTLSGTGLTQTAVFTPLANTDNGIASLTVAAGAYQDAAGNDGAAGITPSLNFDTQAPTLPAANIVVDNQLDPQLVVMTFSENLDASTIGTAADWVVTSHDGSIAFKINSVSISSGKIVRLTLAPVDGGDLTTMVTNALAVGHLKVTPPATLTDAAGNNYSNGLVTESGASHILDTTPPTISSLSISNLTGNTATLTVTTSEKVRAFWMAVPAGSPAPTEAQVKAGANYGAVTVIAQGVGGLSSGAGATLNISGFANPGNFDVYLAANDAAGNAAGTVLTSQAIYSNDATLSALTLSNGTPSPAFDPATTGYTASVGNAVNSITVTPTVNESHATITVNTSTVVSGNASSAIPLNVGDNTITVSVTAEDLATVKTYIITVNRDKFTPTITFAAINKTYGDADFDPGATSDNSNTAIGYTSSNTAVATIVAGKIHIVGAGTANITASQAADATDYAATDVVKTLTVDKKSLTVTLNNTPAITRIYDGTAGATLATGNYTLNGVVGSDAVTISSTASYSDANTGTAKTITAENFILSGAQSDNYTMSTVSATTTGNISVRPLTVSADAQSKNYGDADPALTYQITSGSLVTGESFTGSLTRDAGENVGTYAIHQGTLTLSSNYNLTFTGADLTIGSRAITVTANVQSKTYGDADPALTYQIASGSLVTGESFTGSLTRDAGENVGTYTIHQGTLALSGNYNLTFTGADLTINKATLSIAANDLTKGYGQANPTLTMTYTGFVNGDDASKLTAQPVITTTANTNSAIGNYPITVSGAASPNYSISYVPGTLTVAGATLTITADDQTRVYGSANPVLTAHYSGFINGDDASKLTTVPSLTTVASASSDAGNYTITASGAAIPNYTIVYQPGTLTVHKAQLTVTADNQDRAYGIANPQLTISYSGFVNGDDASKLSTAPTASTVAVANTLPGTYPITVTGATSPNYTFTYVAGTLTIAPLTDASLSGLVVNQGRVTLSPDFSPGTYNYSATVESQVDRVNLTALFPFTATAQIDGNVLHNNSPSNDILLHTGNNSISINVTAQDGSQHTYTISIYRGLPAASITATNILTPNGDGKNDTWLVKDINLYPDNTVSVYDRAGRLVYNKRGYQNDWDGTLKGAPLEQGTYFYTIDLGGGGNLIKGFITIIREQ